MGQNPLLSLILIPSPPPRNNPLHKMRKGKQQQQPNKNTPPAPRTSCKSRNKANSWWLPSPSPHLTPGPLPVHGCGRACCHWTRCFSPVHGAQSPREQGECARGEHGTVPAAGDFKCHALMQGVQIPCVAGSRKAPLLEQSSSQVPWGQLSAPPAQQPVSCTQPPPAPGCPCLPPPCTCRTRLSPFSLVSRPTQSCRSRLTKPLVTTSPVPGRAASPLLHALVVLNQTLSAFSFLLPAFGVAARPALQPSPHGSQLPGASS